MNKWITIKILDQLKNDISHIVKSGKFHSISDFVSYASRNELRNQRDVKLQ